MAEEITIRIANKDDFAAIMELDNDTYMGFDYLAELYEKFEQDANILNIVALIGGKVVGFISMHWIPQDKTIVSVAKRVHREHQRKGIANYLDKMALKKAKAHWSEAELHTWSTLKVPYYEKKLLDPQWKVRCAKERIQMGFIVTHENMHKVTSWKGQEQVNAPLVKQCSQECIEKLQNGNTDLESLFMGKYMTVSHYWQPILVSDISLKSLLEEHIVHCSWDNDSGQCTGLSFGILMQKQSYKRYVMYFYSEKDFADDLFLPHITRHFESINEMNGEGEAVGIAVTAPLGSVSESKILELKSLIENGQGNMFELEANSIILEENINDTTMGSCENPENNSK